MKYDKDLYADCGFFDGDMDCEYVDEKRKLVKCRKPHKCAGEDYCTDCKKEIQKGDYAVCYSAIFPGEGRKSCYVCIPCIEKWLEESGQVNRYIPLDIIKEWKVKQ